MKPQRPNFGHNDPRIEILIRKRDEELKMLSRKKAIHFAKRNCPRLFGDKLVPYIGDIKGGYETLSAEVLQMIQPASHFPQARMEADHARERDKVLAAEVAKKEQENNNDAYDLEQYHPGNIGSRIWTALILTLIIFIGDTIFNVVSFQFVGENLLFSMVLSFCISFTVYLSTHLVPLLYKRVTKRSHKIAMIVGTLILTILVFIALSVFRSQYLASNGISIKPIYFVIINLFFFIVSSLLSYYFLPSLEEIKEHWLLFTRHKNIRRRVKEIEKLKNERANLRKEAVEQTLYHMNATHSAKYLTDRINKMYKEAVEIFKSTNLAFRTDGQTPDCFYGEAPDADIQYSLTAPKS